MQNDSSKSDEEKISSYFEIAETKLKALNAYAKKKKKEIVQDLAKVLEGLIPTNRIASEIVRRLRGLVSERLIHDCLDEKYKEKHRVENARKQKRKHEGAEDLDLSAMFRRTNGKIDNVFFKVSADLGKLVAQIECCGITPQKDVTMTSVGRDVLKEAS